MKTSLLLSLPVSLVLPLVLLTSPLLVSPALAWISVQKVTSESTEERGITAKAKKEKDGTFGFTITRYIAKEEKDAPGSEWVLEGTADLEVRNAGGLLCKTQVAAKTQVGTKDGKQKDTMVYWFSLSRECIPLSRVTLYESASDKNGVQPMRFGHTRYEFDLADIAKRALTPPAHP